MALIMMFLTVVFAKEDWLCTQTASERIGNDIYACGVANERKEEDARSDAFIHAENEFKTLCKADDSCRDHKLIVIPKRTSCEQSTYVIANHKYTNFKCVRLVIFSIQEELEHHKVDYSITNISRMHPIY